MKPTFEQYPTWFKDKFNVNLNTKPSNIYEYVIQKLHKDISGSEFWKEIQSNLQDFSDEYYLINGYHLLRVEELPLHTKSFSSVVNKTYRKNILNNINFPNPPLHDWITPENWFFQIKDLLRTTITVRYLDGVEFITNKIKDIAEKHNYFFTVDYEAREEGYYAAHITINGNFSIVDDNWETYEISFPFEIQITTQLQEVIKSMLHKFYEEKRTIENTEENNKWQWNYKSNEFSSNYLGHILHYVEGMILEVRDKQLHKK